MRRTAVLFAAAIVASCGQTTDEAAEPAPEPQPLSMYAAAVASDARTAQDRARDAGRKPAEVLEFLGITEGMTVLDMYSGGGYYTEILAALVGSGGKVIAHSNEAYLKFVSDEFNARYAGNRLPNVEVLMAENNALSLVPGSLDVIMLVLTYHDFFNDDAENGWPLIDVPALLQELHAGLRPGGIVGVIDHHAAPGAPAEIGNTLHRIDPAIVVAGMQAAGFVLEEQSNVLRNPDDDHGRTVFDPELRGRTDRFVMRFRKPE